MHDDDDDDDDDDDEGDDNITHGTHRWHTSVAHIDGQNSGRGLRATDGR
jgi:hypothetical protein